MLQPVILNLPTQDVVPVLTAATQPPITLDAKDSLLARLFAQAEAAQDAAGAKVKADLDKVRAGRTSTVDLLRLQADMSDFSFRMILIKSVADDLGSAIQTLTQRS